MMPEAHLHSIRTREEWPTLVQHLLPAGTPCSPYTADNSVSAHMVEQSLLLSDEMQSLFAAGGDLRHSTSIVSTLIKLALQASDSHMLLLDDVPIVGVRSKIPSTRGMARAALIACCTALEKTSKLREMGEHCFVKELPMDVHLLDLICAKSGFPVLPLLVVANSENIVQVISSTLYQRRSLNINTPVVGLCVSPYNLFASLYLGWLESTTAAHETLPQVHVAFPARPRKSACGVFDLGDPAFAVSFYRYALQLRSHFNNFRHVAANAVVDPAFRWRFDSHLYFELPARADSWLQALGTNGQKDHSAPCDHISRSPTPPNGSMYDTTETSSQEELDEAVFQHGVNVGSHCSIEEQLATASTECLSSWLRNRCAHSIFDIATSTDPVSKSTEWVMLYNKLAPHIEKEETPLRVTDRHPDACRLRWLQQLHEEVANTVSALRGSAISFCHTWDILLRWSSQPLNGLDKGLEILLQHNLNLPYDMLAEAACSGDLSLRRKCLDSNSRELEIHTGVLYPVRSARIGLKQVNKWTNDPKWLDYYGTVLTEIFAYSRTVRVVNRTETKDLIKYNLAKRASTEPWNLTCDTIITQAAWEFTPSELETSGDLIELLRTHGLFTQQPVDSDPNGTATSKVLIPSIIAHYAKDTDMGISYANDTCCMCLVAIIRFLAAIGIHDYPIFGLYVERERGYLYMAVESCSEGTYLINRNIPAYDISNPHDVVRVQNMLHRIRDYQEQQADKIQNAKKHFLQGKFRDTLRRWSAESHENEMSVAMKEAREVLLKDPDLRHEVLTREETEKEEDAKEESWEKECKAAVEEGYRQREIENAKVA